MFSKVVSLLILLFVAVEPTKKPVFTVSSLKKPEPPQVKKQAVPVVPVFTTPKQDNKKSQWKSGWWDKLRTNTPTNTTTFNLTNNKNSDQQKLNIQGPKQYTYDKSLFDIIIQNIFKLQDQQIKRRKSINSKPIESPTKSNIKTETNQKKKPKQPQNKNKNIPIQNQRQKPQQIKIVVDKKESGNIQALQQKINRRLTKWKRKRHQNITSASNITQQPHINVENYRIKLSPVDPTKIQNNISQTAASNTPPSFKVQVQYKQIQKQNELPKTKIFIASLVNSFQAFSALNSKQQIQPIVVEKKQT